jgi:acetolactate synthase-1/2/3 large subunit
VDPIPYEFEICLKFLETFQQLIFVGALLPVATFAYKNKPTMKSPPGCDLFVMASVEQDLSEALRSLAEATGGAGAAAPRQPRTEAAAPSGDLTAEAIGQSLCMLMPDNAILVDEGATNGPPIFAATKGARAHDYLAPVNGGAIGGGLPLALGAAIACPDRKVVHLQADGSGMYTVQALWSMAREKTDIVIVVLKNDAYIEFILALSSFSRTRAISRPRMASASCARAASRMATAVRSTLLVAAVLRPAKRPGGMSLTCQEICCVLYLAM